MEVWNLSLNIELAYLIAVKMAFQFCIDSLIVLMDEKPSALLSLFYFKIAVDSSDENTSLRSAKLLFLIYVKASRLMPKTICKMTRKL